MKTNIHKTRHAVVDTRVGGKLLGCFLIAALVLFAGLTSGCNTVKVSIPSGAEISGDVVIETNQANWKSNALSGSSAEGRVDAVTTPTTSTTTDLSPL